MRVGLPSGIGSGSVEGSEEEVLVLVPLAVPDERYWGPTDATDAAWSVPP